LTAGRDKRLPVLFVLLFQGFFISYAKGNFPWKVILRIGIILVLVLFFFWTSLAFGSSGSLCFLFGFEGIVPDSGALEPAVSFGAGFARGRFMFPVSLDLSDTGYALGVDGLFETVSGSLSKLELGLGAGYRSSGFGVGPSLMFIKRFSLSWGVGFSGRYLLGSGGRMNELSFGVSILWYPGIADSDRDAVPNGSDHCPATPLGARVDKFGCALDTDRDGVFDGLDRCPNTPYLAIVDSTGCPIDTDADGVFDGVDICPDTPSGMAVDSVGCPKDSDADGIPDFEDTCPETPLGATVDRFGCPSDSDDDGIYDGLDRCPMTPLEVEVDEFGCPLIPPVRKIVITEAFDENGNLPEWCVDSLGSIAERVFAYPNVSVELFVYTDGEGSFLYNINRATRVVGKIKGIFKEKGVSVDEIKFVAKGEVDPIADNATASGRMRNRRIVITGKVKNKEIKGG